MDSQPTSFAQTWWGHQWLQAVARLVNPERLYRGRAYARLGQVSDIEVQIGLILAAVKGTRTQPYSVRIEVETLTDAQWSRVIQALTDRALYVAELLSGEMPQQIEGAFQAAGATLFPARPYEFRSQCSCADPARPCKHVAAACFALAERLDQDPWALFVLRGRTREQILVALRADRAARLESEPGGMPPPEPQPLAAQALAASPERFWQIGSQVGDLEIHIQAPEVDGELLKILGDPVFAQHEGLAAEIAQVYRLVSREALRLAFGSSETDLSTVDNEQDPA